MPFIFATFFSINLQIYANYVKELCNLLKYLLLNVLDTLLVINLIKFHSPPTRMGQFFRPKANF